MIFGLFLINFFFLTQFKFKKKRDYIFVVHPLLYLVFNIFYEILLLLKNIYFLIQDEKNIIKEIPILIDFLKSYLQAGLLLPMSVSSVLKQRKWCLPIQNSLIYICNNYAQGKSFKESLSAAILLVKEKKSRQYLCLLYLSLRIGCASGENIIQIIDKVKNKTQDRLSLERKLKITTAQMRLQSIVIILSPFFLAFIVYLISPEYILFFFNEIIGRALLTVMIVLNVLGAYFLQKILEIK